MAVMMTGKVAGMTAEVYDGMAGGLIPRLQQTKGFISHSAGMAEDGVWTVIEVWESEDDARRWFEENVKPNLPAGVTPDRTYRTLHNFARA
jgi:heme-degrading monooxygenase HmoA